MTRPTLPEALQQELAKISRMQQNLSVPPDRLELDLLKRYVRRYYALLLDWESEGQQAPLTPAGRAAQDHAATDYRTDAGAEPQGPSRTTPSRTEVLPGVPPRQAPIRNSDPASSGSTAATASAGPSTPSASIAPQRVVQAPLPEAGIPDTARKEAGSAVQGPSAPSETPESTPARPAAADHHTASEQSPQAPSHPKAAAPAKPSSEVASERVSPEPAAERPQAAAGHADNAASVPGSFEGPKAEAPKPETPRSPTSDPAANPAESPSEYAAARHGLASSPSLNERFARTEPEHGNHPRLKDQPLGRRIDINERALFVRNLFDGNSEAFNQAVRTIDGFADRAMAERFVDQELAKNHDWPSDSRVVAHFRDLVEQGFA